MHPWLLLWMTDDSISSYRTSCYGSTRLFLLLSNKFYGQQPIYRYSCPKCTTTTIMMANNVNKHSLKELHRSGLRNQHLFLPCMLQVMSPYMTDPTTL